MRILHIVSSLVPGEYRGGISKIVLELACAQAALGNSVVVFTTIYNGTVKTDIAPGTVRSYQGVEIEYFSMTFYKAGYSRDMSDRLRTAAADFDVIHTHNVFLHLNRMAWRSAQESSVRCFFHTHGALDPIVLKRGLLKSIKKRIALAITEVRGLNTAAGIFANTEEECRHIRALGVRPPIHRLPNGIKTVENAGTNLVYDWRRKHMLSADSKIILYVGRINPKKGLHLLIEAFANLGPPHHEWILVLGGALKKGDGYLERLRSMTRMYDVAERVHWLGFMNEEEKICALSAADIYSHVSESEGMAMSILEGMAAGLPVLVGTGCYMSDAARAGAVVECEFTVQSIKAALTRLCSDGSFRRQIGLIARAYVHDNNDWRLIANQSIKYYEAAREQIPEG